ncbi:MAG: DUF2283 domain-containing protein [Methyloceanibacter sp.]
MPAAKQEDVGRGVVLHFDEAGGIVQIELRNARQRLSRDVALPGPPRPDEHGRQKNASHMSCRSCPVDARDRREGRHHCRLL